jgi:hypothetical protein
MKLYEATVTVRIRVEEGDEGNALLRAFEVVDQLGQALPTGASWAAEQPFDDIRGSLKRI